MEEDQVLDLTPIKPLVREPNPSPQQSSLKKFNDYFKDIKQDARPVTSISESDLGKYAGKYLPTASLNRLFKGDETLETEFALTESVGERMVKSMKISGANILSTGFGVLASIPDMLITGEVIGENAPIAKGLFDWRNDVQKANTPFETYYDKENPFKSILLPGFLTGSSKGWGTIVENASYGIGAGAGIAAEGAIFTALTGGTGTIPKLAHSLAKLIKLSKNTKDLAKYIEQGGTALKNIDNALDVSEEALSLAKKEKFFSDVLEGTKDIYRTTAMSYSEAQMEALEGKSNYIEQQTLNFKKTFGYDPTGKELEEINKKSSAVYTARFAANMALLGASNYVSNRVFFGGLDKLKDSLNKFKNEGIEGTIDQLGNLSFGDDAFKLSTTSKWWEKGFGKGVKKGIEFGVNTVRKTPLALSEGVEEGGQFIIDKATNNYFAFDNKKAKQDLLTSITDATKELFTTTEGQQSMLLGMLGGSGQQVVGNITQSIGDKALSGTEGYIPLKERKALKLKQLNEFASQYNTPEVGAVNVNSVFGTLDRKFKNTSKLLAASGALDEVLGNKELERRVGENISFNTLAPFVEMGMGDVAKEMFKYRMDSLTEQEWEATGIKKSKNEIMSDFSTKIKTVEEAFNMTNKKFINPYTKDTEDFELFEAVKGNYAYTLFNIQRDVEESKKIKQAHSKYFDVLKNFANVNTLKDGRQYINNKIKEQSDRISLLEQAESTQFTKDELKKAKLVLKNYEEIKSELSSIGIKKEQYSKMLDKLIFTTDYEYSFPQEVLDKDESVEAIQDWLDIQTRIKSNLEDVKLIQGGSWEENKKFVLKKKKEAEILDEQKKEEVPPVKPITTEGVLQPTAKGTSDDLRGKGRTEPIQTQSTPEKKEIKEEEFIGKFDEKFKLKIGDYFETGEIVNEIKKISTGSRKGEIGIVGVDFNNKSYFIDARKINSTKVYRPVIKENGVEKSEVIEQEREDNFNEAVKIIGDTRGNFYGIITDPNYSQLYREFELRQPKIYENKKNQTIEDFVNAFNKLIDDILEMMPNIENQEEATTTEITKEQQESINKINNLIEDGKKAVLIDETSTKESHYKFIGKLYQRVSNFVGNIINYDNNKSVTNIENAIPVGNYFDTFARMYYNNPILTIEQFTNEIKNRKDYKQLSKINISSIFEESKKRFSEIKEQIKKDLNDENLVFITDQIFVHSTFKNEEWDGVAGTLDMVVIDSKGKIHIYDFKTKSEQNSKYPTTKTSLEDTKFGESYSEKWNKQQSAYSKMIENTFGYNPNINIILIPVSYDREEFNGDYRNKIDVLNFKPSPSNVKFTNTNPFIYKLVFDKNNKLVVKLDSLKEVSKKEEFPVTKSKASFTASKPRVAYMVGQENKDTEVGRNYRQAMQDVIVTGDIILTVGTERPATIYQEDAALIIKGDVEKPLLYKEKEIGTIVPSGTYFFQKDTPKDVIDQLTPYITIKDKLYYSDGVKATYTVTGFNTDLENGNKYQDVSLQDSRFTKFLYYSKSLSKNILMDRVLIEQYKVGEEQQYKFIDALSYDTKLEDGRIIKGITKLEREKLEEELIQVFKDSNSRFKETNQYFVFMVLKSENKSQSLNVQPINIINKTNTALEEVEDFFEVEDAELLQEKLKYNPDKADNMIGWNDRYVLIDKSQYNNALRGIGTPQKTPNFKIFANKNKENKVESLTLQLETYKNVENKLKKIEERYIVTKTSEGKYKYDNKSFDGMYDLLKDINKDFEIRDFKLTGEERNHEWTLSNFRLGEQVGKVYEHQQFILSMLDKPKENSEIIELNKFEMKEEEIKVEPIIIRNTEQETETKELQSLTLITETNPVVRKIFTPEAIKIIYDLLDGENGQMATQYENYLNGDSSELEAYLSTADMRQELRSLKDLPLKDVEDSSPQLRNVNNEIQNKLNEYLNNCK